MLNSVSAINQAMEVFVRGFAFTRSIVYPFHAELLAKDDAPLWVMRDAPRKSGDVRTEEYVTCGGDPEKIVGLARQHARGRYFICWILPADQPDAGMRASFRQLRYRLITTEPLMIHTLKKIPRFDPPEGITIARVTTPEMAEALRKAAGKRQILKEHLPENHPNPPLRQYIALAGEKPVGWVRSIQVETAEGKKATWCSNMGVLPAFRRRGIARALLAMMLRDDRKYRSTSAVLLASHTGALVYPLLGYQKIGTLFMFTPPKGGA